MYAHLEGELARYLESGESLIWSGSPSQGLILRPAAAFLIPFSLMWGGFAIFWEFTVIASGGPFFFMLWGIPFVLVGLYLIVGRFFVDARRRAKTIYGLTAKRAIIVSGLMSRSVNSIPLATLNDLTLKERANGSGTITLGRPHPMAMWSAGMQWPGMGQYETPSFEMIPNAKTVHDQVLQAKSSAA